MHYPRVNHDPMLIARVRNMHEGGIPQIRIARELGITVDRVRLYTADMHRVPRGCTLAGIIRHKSIVNDFIEGMTWKEMEEKYSFTNGYKNAKPHIDRERKNGNQDVINEFERRYRVKHGISPILAERIKAERRRGVDILSISIILNAPYHKVIAVCKTMPENDSISQKNYDAANAVRKVTEQEKEHMRQLYREGKRLKEIQTITKRGWHSVNDAIKDILEPHRQKNRRITEEEISTVRKLMGEGATFTAACSAIKRGRLAMHAYVEDLVKFRTKMTEEEKSLARELYKGGMSQDDIRKKMKKGWFSINNALRDLIIEKRGETNAKRYLRGKQAEE